MDAAMFRIEMFLRAIGILARYRLYSVHTQEFSCDFAPVPAYFRTLWFAKRAARKLVRSGRESSVEILAVTGSEWCDLHSIWTQSYSPVVARIRKR